MMKLSTRYGDMFSWGWLPPAGAMQAGFIAVFGVGVNGLELSLAHKLPVAAVRVAWAVVPDGTWLWAGSSEMLSVWLVSPPSSPKTIPLPTCTGERPWRLGRAKFTLPSPP